MDVRNSDLLLDFVETIEFSENLIPKKEIKEEEGLKIEKQEFSKTPSFDVKPKLEPVEASEIGQATIKTEPEEFFSNDQTETLSNESIEIKDEFMWTMKDFLSDNVPPRNIEQQIAAVHEKKKAFECSLCPYKVNRKGNLNKHILSMYLKIHIASVHEKK